MRNAEAEFGKVVFRGLSGSLAIRDRALLLSSFEGKLGQGRLFGITGLVPLTRNRDVRLKGQYAMDLKGLASLAGTEGIEVLAGTAEGDIELRGRQARGFSVEGAGTLRDGSFVWKRLALEASGSYAFKDRRVTFAPLVIRGAATRLVMRGSAEKAQADLQVRGIVDSRQIEVLLGRPYHLQGPVERRRRGGAQGRRVPGGRACGDDRPFVRDTPGDEKRTRGRESAFVSLHGKKGGELTLDNLDYTLGPLDAAFSATVGEGRVSHLHLALDIPRVEELSRLFFFDDRETRGDLKADVQVEDLPYPVTKLPLMRGYLTFRGSILHLSALALPLTGIDLAATFEGDRFTVDLSGLRVGTSALSKAHIVVAGLDAPHFTLGVDMDSFDPVDFEGIYGNRFRMPVIVSGSLADRTTGEFLLRSDKVRLRGVILKDLEMKGSFGGRMLMVTQGGAEMGKGELVFQGTPISGPPPG